MGQYPEQEYSGCIPDLELSHRFIPQGESMCPQTDERQFPIRSVRKFDDVVLNKDTPYTHFQLGEVIVFVQLYQIKKMMINQKKIQ